MNCPCSASTCWNSLPLESPLCSMHSEVRFAKLLVVSYPPASVVVSKKYFNLQGVSIQKTAMAARKSYSKEALSDVDEMAAMGNWGRNPSHIAEQMTTKYCEASHLGLPEPYLVETPVVLKSNEDSAVSVATRQIGVFLPHDWFAWMGSDSLEEAVKHSITGLPDLQPFWSCHEMKDPKFCKNPVTEKNRRKFWPLILHGDGGAFQGMTASMCCQSDAFCPRPMLLPVRCCSWPCRKLA